MQLIIQCPKCGTLLSIPLPDETTEAEAARIAQDVVRCADCLRAMPSATDSAPQAMQQATAGITKANGSQTSLVPVAHINEFR